MPNKEHLIDDGILFTISRELSQDELDTLLENPDLIFDIMEGYKNNEDYSDNLEELEEDEKMDEESEKKDNSFESNETTKKKDEKRSNIPKAPELNSMQKIAI